MRSNHRKNHGLWGASLIEAMIAMGALAVALPLVIAAFAGSGESGVSSQAETRSIWIVPACLEELNAAREGRAIHLPEINEGVQFPARDKPFALAFSADGKVVGGLSSQEYHQGVKHTAGGDVRYIASLHGDWTAGKRPLLRVRIVQEYPSIAPAAKRRKIEFITQLP